MEDYKIQLKVQNGHLFRMMESRGLKTVSELSRATGIGSTELGKIANLKKGVYNKQTGKLTPSCEKLCDFFFCDITDIVPEQHIVNPLLNSVTERYVTKYELAALEIDSTNPSLMIDKDLISVKSITDMSISLTDRERRVIKMHFEDGKTYTYIANILDVSVERARQIEQKAILKLSNKKNEFSDLMEVYRDEAI
jgi:RNA polymerase sigma factor (sigma-70 family)